MTMRVEIVHTDNSFRPWQRQCCTCGDTIKVTLTLAKVENGGWICPNCLKRGPEESAARLIGEAKQLERSAPQLKKEALERAAWLRKEAAKIQGMDMPTFDEWESVERSKFDALSVTEQAEFNDDIPF